MNILKNYIIQLISNIKNEFFFNNCHKSITNRSENSDRILNPSQICDKILILSQNSDKNTISSQFSDRFITEL